MQALSAATCQRIRVTCIVAKLCVFFLYKLLSADARALLGAELALQAAHLCTEVANTRLLRLRTRSA